ncbi:MAG: GNAT family N-acetyltransferase [Anaerolineae bacterium]|nr:GNAT family N-acetyltransferase [Anaerolineae bacterium]
MSQQLIVRDLSGADAAAYQAIRLRALKDHPEAFASAYEDEKEKPLAQIVESLDQPTTERFMLGAFDGEVLVGIVGGYRDGHRKSKHRAHIVAMYVAEEARGRGIGRSLLVEAIKRLRAMDGVEEIVLAVTVGNDTARSLYASLGFEAAYIEPRFFKIEGSYYDLEWMILRFVD